MIALAKGNSRFINEANFAIYLLYLQKMLKLYSY